MYWIEIKVEYIDKQKEVQEITVYISSGSIVRFFDNINKEIHKLALELSLHQSELIEYIKENDSKSYYTYYFKDDIKFEIGHVNLLNYKTVSTDPNVKEEIVTRSAGGSRGWHDEIYNLDLFIHLLQQELVNIYRNFDSSFQPHKENSRMLSDSIFVTREMINKHFMTGEQVKQILHTRGENDIEAFDYKVFEEAYLRNKIKKNSN